MSEPAKDESKRPADVRPAHWFPPGNKAAAGHKKGPRKTPIHDAVIKMCREDESVIPGVIASWLKMIERGNPKALELWLAYVDGPMKKEAEKMLPDLMVVQQMVQQAPETPRQPNGSGPLSADSPPTTLAPVGSKSSEKSVPAFEVEVQRMPPREVTTDEEEEDSDG